MTTALRGSLFSNLIKLSHECHVDKWKEQKLNKEWSIEDSVEQRTNLKLLIDYNSKFQYEQLEDINTMYSDLCDVMIIIIEKFGEQAVGNIIYFLLESPRLYYRPVQIPTCLKDINRVYSECYDLWSNVVSDGFLYLHDTLFSKQYEVKSFVRYFAIEVVVTECFSEESGLQYTKIMNSFLDVLQAPILNDVDKYFLRKIIWKITEKSVPVLSQVSTHPIVTLVNNVFVNYYREIKVNWQRIVDAEQVSFNFILKSDVKIFLQAFLIDNFYKMSYWRTKDYIVQMNAKLKPYFIHILNYKLSSKILHKAVSSSFYGLISFDVSSNLLDHLFKSICLNLDNFLRLTLLWNNQIGSEILFTRYRSKNEIFVNLFRLCIRIKTFNEAFSVVELIAKHVQTRRYVKDQVDAILHSLATHSWDVNKSMVDQILVWFKENI